MVKILVIDDVSALREEIETLLDFEGYEVLGAGSGYQGISLAKASSPDLIICDIEMPDLNGYQVFSELQAETQTEFIPFIFLTARSSREDFRAGMNLGADDYLTKPFEQDDLLNAIQTRLQRSHAAKDAGSRKSQHEKEILIQRISQELQNPVNSMNLANSLIRQLLGNSLPPHMSMILSTYHAGVERLQRYSEQLMLQLQLEAESINEAVIFENGEFMSTQELLESGIALAHDFAKERKHIELRVAVHSGATKLFGIPDLLKHALGEIIANALDFSHENRAVVIKQWVKEGIVSILVIDEGRGIPLDEIDNIFQPFQRARKDQETRKGLGLGLSLTNQIIVLHGGRIKLNSSEIGTSVLIQFPAV